ncbi:recombinase family protein, partial [Rhodopirellula bahusiensis]
YAEGNSLRELCTWLTAQGVKTRRGNDWQQQSVRHTINNIVYRGHLAYGKSSASKYLPHGSPDGVRRDRPEAEWNVMQGTHEPLVSQELFERCQERREYNRKMTGPKGKNRFPLTGLLFCERCGSRMCGQVNKNQQGVRRYICLGYTQNFTKCKRRTVKEAEVLPQVVKAIRTQFIEPLLGDAMRSDLRERMKEILLANESSVTRNRKVAEVRLAKLDGELEQAVNAMLSTSEDLRPLVENRVRAIQDERDQLADEMTQDLTPATEQLARAEQRVDAAIGWLDRLEEAINTDFDEKALHELLRQFVERVTIDVDRVPQGKRSRCVLLGGSVHLRSESLPNWLIPDSEKSASPPGRLCFGELARW